MNDAGPDDAGASRSPWLVALHAPRLGWLPTAVEVDACVIGAGAAGLSAAYELVLQGLRVLVLEEGVVGDGETARTTAHLASALRGGFAVHEALHGTDGARLARESHAVAIDHLHEIVRTEAIACDFARVDGYVFGDADQDLDLLREELAAAHRAGFTDAELVTDASRGLATGIAIRFPNQAELHPTAYVEGLARAIERRGGRILTGVRVDRVEDGDFPRVFTSGGSVITAGAVVVATTAPIDLPEAAPLEHIATRSYAVALAIPRGSLPHALYADMQEPVHSARIAHDADGEEMLVLAGEDHDLGEERDVALVHDRLEAWGRARCPTAGARRFAWSAQVLEPVDGLAFIGRWPGTSGVYVMTGDAEHGMSHGVLGGMLVRDLVTGAESPWARLYDPQRKTLSSAKRFASDLVATSAHDAWWLSPTARKEAEGGDEEPRPRDTLAYI